MVFAGIEPQLWETWQAAAVGRVICFQMSRGWLIKFINLAVAEHLGDELQGNMEDFENIMDGDNDVPITVPKGCNIEVNEINWEGIAKMQNDLPPTDQGSNSWVLSGKYTDDGKPHLASDPHLAVSLPSIWYQMHLKCDEFDIAGVSIPGLPFVSIVLLLLFFSFNIGSQSALCIWCHLVLC